MEQEVDVCCDLVTLSEQEKVAIIENDVQALASIVEKKQTDLNLMQKLKGKRDGLTDGIQVAGEHKLSLHDIIRTVPGGRELTGLVDKLEGMIVKLKSINALNKMLIDTQQKYTSFCINLLTGRDSTPGTYSVSGRMDDTREANQSLVDQAI